MKLSDAISFFEQHESKGGGNALLSYTKAVKEYESDCDAAVKYELSFYSEPPEPDTEPAFERIDTPLDYLTMLKLEIAKIGGFNLDTMSVYEARRIRVVHYREILRLELQRYLDLIEDRDAEAFRYVSAVAENLRPELCYIDGLQEAIDIVKSKYEDLPRT
jgi:hypothetical protein